MLYQVLHLFCLLTIFNTSPFYILLILLILFKGRKDRREKGWGKSRQVYLGHEKEKVPNDRIVLGERFEESEFNKQEPGF